MVVIGSFGFVENSGTSFEETGLEECMYRRAMGPKSDGNSAFRRIRKSRDTDRERSTASTSPSLPHFLLISFQTKARPHISKVTVPVDLRTERDMAGSSEVQS